MLRGRFGGFWETLIEDDGGVGVGEGQEAQHDHII